MAYFVYSKQKWQKCSATDIEMLLRDDEIKEADPAWNSNARQWTTVRILRSTLSSKGIEFSASSRRLKPTDSVDGSNTDRLSVTKCQKCGATNPVFRGNHPRSFRAICGTCKTALPARKIWVVERLEPVSLLVSAALKREKWPCLFGVLVAASTVYLAYPRTLWLSQPTSSLLWIENLAAALLLATVLSAILSAARRRYEAHEILELRRRYDAIMKERAAEEFAWRQRASGLEMFEGSWLKKAEIDKILAVRLGLQNNFQNITPYEFEQLVARLFRAMGFSCQVTSKSGDYGIDVIARKGTEIVAIQCKRNCEDNLVGNRTITMLLGAMPHIRTRATRGIVVTTSGFTRQARHQAEGCPVELWDKSRLHSEIQKWIRAI